MKSGWLRDLAFGDARRPSLPMIFLFALAGLAVIGYKFAVWDQLLYLGLVDRYFQPIVDHPGDIYIGNFLWKTYTTFWMLFYPLKQAAGWEWPLFLIHLLAQFFICWGIWALTLALTRDRLAAWLGALFMLINKVIVGGGIQLYMPDTITRFVVIPFMLFGLKMFWERKYLGSALLFGIGFHIHAMSAVYWMLAAALGFIYYRMDGAAARRPPVPPAERRLEIRRLWLALLLFILVALPILVWQWFAPPAPGDCTTPDFIEIVRAKNSFLFLSNYDPGSWKILLLSVLLIVAAVRHLPAEGIARWYAPWAMGIVTMLFLYYLAADVLFYQPIYRLQWIRAIDLLGLLAMIGAARILAVCARGGWRQRGLAACAGAFLLLGVIAPGRNSEMFTIAVFLVLLLALEPRPGRFSFPALLILAVYIGTQLGRHPWDGSGSIKSPVWVVDRVAALAVGVLLFAGWFRGLAARCGAARNAVTACCLAGLVLLVCCVRLGIAHSPVKYSVEPDFRPAFWRNAIGKIGANIDWPGRGLKTDWIQFQFWVRDHTPPGTLFFVPPGLNGFRAFSQRNAFFEIYDVEPAIYQPAYAAALAPRLKLFDYWPPHELRSAPRASRAYHATTVEDWRKLARQWDASYLITDHPVDLSFPKLHARGQLTLWQLADTLPPLQGGLHSKPD